MVGVLQKNEEDGHAPVGSEGLQSRSYSRRAVGKRIGKKVIIFA